jgi:hypothetical protein
MTTHLKFGGEFIEKALNFFKNHNEKPDPQEHLEFLRGLANRFKERVQAGEFDPKPAEQEQQAAG